MALARALPKLTKPGVRIKIRKGVPYFHADFENPKLLIRQLDGKITRGKIVDGKFRVINK